MNRKRGKPSGLPRARSTPAACAARRFRIGSLASVTGAVACVSHIVARSLLTAGFDPATAAEAPLWVPGNTIGAVGSALVLPGLPGIADRIAPRVGPAGRAGLALIAGSWIFFGPFLSLCGALVRAWLAAEAPGLLPGAPATPTVCLVAFASGSSPGSWAP